MKHGRTSAAGTGAVHALSTMVSTAGLHPPRQFGALCGTSYTSELVGPGRYQGRWNYTDEPVTCRRCLEKLERLAEQALLDERAISTMADVAVHRPGSGSNARPADPDKVRAFRRAWPAMGRAVADLLRHRGVRLGEGWTGPTRLAGEVSR
ncbi:hypothetical protein [Actinophytocola sp.]|uniref:hypothetical protein n=1 Tax=Actinophytocola sp. TaxID=1872138 RepID=UPI002D7E5EC8|nr:hypothetical protein [Actinophytocola sp.]HET9144058.1 hypothetical protein [Actinophytocola sp.]